MFGFQGCQFSVEPRECLFGYEKRECQCHGHREAGKELRLFTGFQEPGSLGKKEVMGSSVFNWVPRGVWGTGPMESPRARVSERLGHGAHCGSVRGAVVTLEFEIQMRQISNGVRSSLRYTYILNS